MKQQFYKAGPWLFFLCVLWYLGGNYLIAVLHAHSRELAESQHQSLTSMKVGQRVVIHAAGMKNMSRKVRLELIQGSDLATIRNDDLNLTVQGQMRDGVLHITIKAVQEEPSYRHLAEHNPTDFLIQLPASVAYIETAGDVSLEVLARDTVNPTQLNLTIGDCAGEIRVSHLKAKRLNLSSACSTNSENFQRDNTFDLAEKLELEELSVTMVSGKLDYAAKQVPKQSWLKLGDGVLLSAKSEFLRQAHQEKYP